MGVKKSQGKTAIFWQICIWAGSNVTNYGFYLIHNYYNNYIIILSDVCRYAWSAVLLNRCKFPFAQDRVKILGHFVKAPSVLSWTINENCIQRLNKQTNNKQTYKNTEPTALFSPTLTLIWASAERLPPPRCSLSTLTKSLHRNWTLFLYFLLLSSLYNNAHVHTLNINLESL